MEILFWSCLAFGVLLALATLLIGDFGGTFDFLPHDLFEPVVLAGGITIFGGAGLLLDRYAPLASGGVYACAAAAAVLGALAMHFVYVRPMRDSENSVAYSIRDLEGKRAEVITSIPAVGYGEVLVRVGAGNANHIAESFDKEALAEGTKVVVVRVKDDVLGVSKLD
ncbi:protease [Cohnella sp. JJ-181]|uniref:protease n=1 Tax=Cohnella rhizoplanae TaxID=2974897 RepID=UPI0022FF6DBE|nr:protease [Cohnella sp. JJ-181]CAI6022307.1 putative membrane protein YuaF [Cohnella sp. JJ-181]